MILQCIQQHQSGYFLPGDCVRKPGTEKQGIVLSVTLSVRAFHRQPYAVVWWDAKGQSDTLLTDIEHVPLEKYDIVRGDALGSDLYRVLDPKMETETGVDILLRCMSSGRRVRVSLNSPDYQHIRKVHPVPGIGDEVRTNDGEIGVVTRLTGAGTYTLKISDGTLLAAVYPELRVLTEDLLELQSETEGQ